jgi:hypothetical protein
MFERLFGGKDMPRSLVVAAALLTVAPAVSQTPAPMPWSNEIDPAAIVNYDPDGAAGIPLTVENVHAYLSGPVPRSRWLEENELTAARRVVAKQARADILSDPNLLTPLWTEQAFELQDGTVRPMTAREKAVFAEFDALEAIPMSQSAQQTLSRANESERAMLADAIVRLLKAGVRLSGRQTDGYRKVDGDWMFLDYEDGQLASSRLALPEVENALLRYELAKATMFSGAQVRRPTTFLQVTRQ